MPKPTAAYALPGKYSQGKYSQGLGGNALSGQRYIESSATGQRASARRIVTTVTIHTILSYGDRWGRCCTSMVMCGAANIYIANQKAAALTMHRESCSDFADVKLLQT